MKIKIFMTGSDGNCTWLSYKDTNILIDCGFKTQKLMKETLEELLSKVKIDGILITHEHNDHFTPWTGRLSIEYGIPIYLHKKHYETEEARKTKYLSYENKKEGKIYYAQTINIEENSEFYIKDLKIETFTSYHDARKTLGFIFNDNQLCWVTDCGFLSTYIKDKIKQCNNLALEFTYDIKKLIDSDRHWKNKLRTLGKFGHLSIDEALKFLKNIKYEKQFKKLITLHSSEKHCDLNELENKIKEINPNIVDIYISNRFNNEIIEIEDL